MAATRAGRRVAHGSRLAIGPGAIGRLVAGLVGVGLLGGGCATPLGSLSGIVPRGEVRKVLPASAEAAASAAFLHGRLLELEGDLPGAATAYEAALAHDRDAPELLGYLSDVWYRMAKPDQALPHAQRAHELAPDDKEAVRRLARVYAALRRFDEVAALLEPAFESGELGSAGTHELFELYLRMKRFDDAERVARKLVEREPESLRSLFSLSRAMQHQDQLAEAEAALREAQTLAPYDARVFDALARLRQRAEDGPGEIAVLEEKLEVLPGDPVALLRIAQIREAQEDRLGATRALETLIHHHPAHIGAQFQLGYFYFEDGRYDEAVERFETVLEHSGTLRDPGYRHEVSYFLALAAFEAERYDDVTTTLASVPPGSKRYPDARILAARALERQKRFGEALAEAESAREVVPDNVPVQVYVAGLLQRTGELEAAVALMDGLIESDPENADLRYDLGLIYSNAGDEESALEAMMRALEHDGDHASALNFVGYTFADRGTRLDDAHDMIVRALELRPDDGYIKDSMGWVRYKRGLKLLDEGRVREARDAFEDAIADLEAALELLEHEDPIITFHLGDAYRSASRFEEALRAYRRALELEPSEEDALAIRERIELLELQTGRASPAPAP